MSSREKDSSRRIKKKKRPSEAAAGGLEAVASELAEHSEGGLDEHERSCVVEIELSCTVYDFHSTEIDAEKKDRKKKALLDVLQFVHDREGLLVEPILTGIVKMFSINVLRCLPPNENAEFDPDEDEQKLEPSWPHLNIVYEIFLRVVESPNFNVDLAKTLLTEKFIYSFMETFNAEDPREREMLKTILHRIYAKIVPLRLYIRKQMSYIFFRYAYESEYFNGIGELLEICGSIINGFNLPLKEEHKLFFRRALLPLLKTSHLTVFHAQLIYCIVQFVERDSALTELTVSRILKYWPKVCSHKEVIFLSAVEELADVIELNQFVKIQTPLFRQIAKCIVSSHFQVAERALYFWNNDYLLSLLRKNVKTIMPIVFPAVYMAKDHWNKAIVALAYNVLKSFMEMDPELFDRLIQPLQKTKTSALAHNYLGNERSKYISGDDS